MKFLEYKNAIIQNKNGETEKVFGTIIPFSNFGDHSKPHALFYSLQTLGAIEKINRFNLLLKEFDKAPIDSSIFYCVLASILEKDKVLTPEYQERYFEVIKQLFKYSKSVHYLNDDLFFIPAYELDMLVLGVVTKEYTDQYADLNYSFMNNEITYTEFVQKFKEQHPTE